MRVRWSLAVVITIAAVAVAASPAAADDDESIGVETAAFPPIGATWLETLNRYRAQSGLAPVVAEPSWVAGQLDHIEYLAKTSNELRTGTFASAHTQNPESPWFTREGASAAAASNITIGTGANERGLIDLWMSAPFHAIGILRANLGRAAFATRDGMAMLDITRGLRLPAPPAAEPILFPGPDSLTYLSRFVAEAPDPREGCATDPRTFRGLPIIALLPLPPLAGIAATVDLPDGRTLTAPGPDLCIQTAATFDSTDAIYGISGETVLATDNAVIVIPREPLEPGLHEVTLTQDNRADVAWAFNVVGPPGAPSTTRALWAGGDTAVVWWDPPMRDNGVAVTEYARFVEGTRSYTRLAEPSGRGAVVDVDGGDVGATNGEVSIAAVNQIGPSPRVDVPWTRLSLPGTPTDTHVVAVATGAPAATSAVLVNLAMTDATLPGYITADRCATMRDEPQTRASGNHGVDTAVANLSVVPVDDLGVFCLYSQVPTHLVVDVQGRFSPEGALRFTSIAPRRLLDTRAAARPAPGTIVRVETGLGGIATAALVNLAMTDGPSAGYITADACSALVTGPQTKASGNHAAEVAISNLAVVSLDSDGAFCIYTQRGAHLVADLQGWFSPTGELAFDPAAPRRVMDTRDAGAQPGSGSITVVHTGLDGAQAALVNIAMVDGLAPGYITADTCLAMTAGPQTRATGNHDGSDAAANLAVVPLDPDGTFCVYTQSDVHLVVDVQGAFAPDGALGFDPVAPTRVLDTRL